MSPETYVDAETLQQTILADSIVGNQVYEEDADTSDILSRRGSSIWDDEDDY